MGQAKPLATTLAPDQTPGGKMSNCRFASIPKWVQALKPGLGPLAVYTALAQYANTDRECWPSVATLADDLGVSGDTVTRHIKALVALGAVQKTNRWAATGQTSNLYVLPMSPDAAALPSSEGWVDDPHPCGTPPPHPCGTPPRTIAAHPPARLRHEQDKRTKPMNNTPNVVRKVTPARVPVVLDIETAQALKATRAAYVLHLARQTKDVRNPQAFVAWLGHKFDEEHQDAVVGMIRRSSGVMRPETMLDRVLGMRGSVSA